MPNDIEEQVAITDIASPKIETNTRLPEDSFRNEDYRSEVAAAVAKLKGVTHTDGEAPEEEKVSGERVRDENGRFAPKAGESAAAPPVEQNAPTEDGQDAKPIEPASKPIGGPPPGWSAESKAKFAELPPSIQADVLKREKEVSDGFRQVSERIRPLMAVEEIIAPRREFFAQHGFQNDAQVINHLMSYSDAMDRDPTGTIKVLADAYRVDLGKLFGANPAQAGQEEGEIPPAVAELRQRNAILEQRLQSIEGSLTVQQRRSEAERAHQERLQSESIVSEVSTFSADKPHFQKVRPLMGALLQSGAAKGLEDAYQMAVFADPETRVAVQAEEDAKRRAGEEMKKRQAAEKAKAAAVSIRQGAAPSPAPATITGTGNAYRDDVKADVLAAFKKVQARV